eukprot:scaffold69176_cov60-Phaeocystis_antarctica.AAC.6
MCLIDYAGGPPSMQGVLVDHCEYLGLYIGLRAEHPSVWLRLPPCTEHKSLDKAYYPQNSPMGHTRAVETRERVVHPLGLAHAIVKSTAYALGAAADDDTSWRS